MTSREEDRSDTASAAFDLGSLLPWRPAEGKLDVEARFAVREDELRKVTAHKRSPRGLRRERCGAEHAMPGSEPGEGVRRPRDVDRARA